MKRFVITTAIFLSLLVVGDRLVSVLLQLYRPIDYKQFIDAKRSLFDSDQSYDVLLIGDSHIADAVDPRCLDSICGLSAFNLGIYHATPFENYYVMKAALAHLKQKPKLIVLGTNPEMFGKPATAGRYTTLIMTDLESKWNLYKDAEVPIDASFFLRTIHERYLFSSLYKELRGVKYRPTREVRTIYNGYLESRNQIRGTKWSGFKPSSKKREFNVIQQEYFQRMIDLAEQEGIKVVIVNPPMWSPWLAVKREASSFQAFSRVIESYRRDRGLPVFNPEAAMDATYQQHEFLNTEHLNFFGAKKFSSDLAQWISRDSSTLSFSKH